MSESDLDARLDAVERALTDGDADLAELREASEAAGDLRDLESRLADLESRVDELEAGLQAVRGYAGNVRAVNREVERRASAALAKAEALETAVEDDRRRPVDGTRPTDDPSPGPSAQGRHPDGEASRSGAGRPSDRSTTRASALDSDGSGPRVGREGDPMAAGVESEARRRTGDPLEARSGDASEGESSSERSRGDRRRDGRGEDATDGGSHWIDDASADADPESDGADSQTEQFIERVRDAL
ncbi:MAG: hypothetical protein ABEJ26_07665 [Halosimplex sp.]